MSDRRKPRYVSRDNRFRGVVRGDGVEYTSARIASGENRLSERDIEKAIDGRQLTCGGWTWQWQK